MESHLCQNPSSLGFFFRRIFMTDKYLARSGREIKRALINAEVNRLVKELEMISSKILPNIEDEQHRLLMSNIAIQSHKERGMTDSAEYRREVIKNGGIQRRMESHRNSSIRAKVINQELKSLELELF